LGALVGLTKLQLDNNIIERIENLELLVNLQWLDLSFNNIEYIEGLDNLTKLTDLTLFNNQIKKIENMDKLENLHVLSLGNNEIANPEEVIYLRRFKHLKSLNLKGNSMCKNTNHQAFVVAHLENVTFFNFRLIDEGMRKQALDKYAVAISELERVERQEATAHAEELRVQEETETFLKANIVGFGGGRIFDEMYEEDTELPKLKILKGYEELMEEQGKQVVEICREITKTALHHMEILDEEKNQFKLCVDEAKDEATAKSVAIVADLENRLDALMTRIAGAPPSGRAALVTEGENMIADGESALMQIENEIFEQIDEVLSEFERNISELSGAALEPIQGFITQIREVEANHNEKVTVLATDTMEAFTKGEIEGNITEGMRQFFIDKDTMNNVLQTSHDVHLQKIDNREDEIVQRSATRLETLSQKLNTEEIERNRRRVAEIGHFIKKCRGKLDA